MRTFSLKTEPRHLQLCTDRLFHERLRARFLRKRTFLLMSEMIFESKRRIRFVMQANLALSFSIQVVNRQTLLCKWVAGFYGSRVSTTLAHNFLEEVFLRQERPGLSRVRLTHDALLIQHHKTLPEPQAGCVPKPSLDTRAPVFLFGRPEPVPATSSPREAGGRSDEVHHTARRNFLDVDPRRQILALTVISSIKSAHRHDFERRLSEWVTRRHLPFPVSLKSRKETFPSADSKRKVGSAADRNASGSTPVIGAAPEFEGMVAKKKKKQELYLAGLLVRAAAQEFVFPRTKKIVDEIDILKTSLRRTEERINDKVVRELKEVVKTQIPKVDIGSLSFQVYRNIERMIRTEREKRGI